LGGFIARPFARLQTVGDVFRHRHVREQRVILEHDADAALAWRQMIDRLAVEQHPAIGLPDEAGHDPKQRRLSTTGRAQQGDQLAASDVQIYIAHRGEVVEPLRDAIEGKPMTTIRRYHLKARNLRFSWQITIAVETLLRQYPVLRGRA
jgi:hypothetical protein